MGIDPDQRGSEKNLEGVKGEKTKIRIYYVRKKTIINKSRKCVC